MTPTETAAPVSDDFLLRQRSAMAGHIDTVLESLEELSESPLTPEQYECVYRMLGAARTLRDIVHDPAPAAGPGPRLEAAPSDHGRLYRILLLDRGRVLGEIVGQTLAGLPHVLDRCADRADALALFRERRYDIVLADPRCAPELPAVLRIVSRERGDDAAVPVVAVHTPGSSQSAQALVNAGFDAILPRKFDRETLIRLLAGYSIAIPSAPPAVRGMQAEFLGRVQVSLEPARRALARCDSHALLECADSVGGAAAVLGFHLLAQVAARLRHAAGRNEWRRAGRCLDEIAAEAEIAAVSTDIDSLCGSGH